jgi:hypothetical protein
MPVGHLGPAFPGFSYEKTHLTDGFFSGTNAPLIAMFKLLGSGISLRLAGNAVDRSSWMPAAMPVAGGSISTTIGQADVDMLASFAKASGAKVIYGINLKSNTPAVAADEAKYAAGALGADLYAFEVGNEISQFGTPYATLKPQWDALVTAIKGAVPNAVFSGPDCYRNQMWTDSYAKDAAGDLVLLTGHYYLGAGGAGSMAKMLSPDPTLPPMLQAFGADVTANHIRDGYRFTEANSFFNHGTPGVSDTAGSALWAIDYMLTSAQGGSSGINFHGGGYGQDLGHPMLGFWYEPIEEMGSKVTAAKPMFHGMLFVALAGTGPMYPTTAKAGALNFSAYSVGQADGSINIVLVNKDPTSAVQATVDAGAAVTGASALYLESTSLTAMAVTLAGAPVSPSGAWSPNPPYRLAATGNMIEVTVPAAGAALVHAQ